VLTSADGESWTPRAPGTASDLHGVGHGNERFVAVGYGGALFSSADGVAWTALSSNVKDQLDAVGYGQYGFVAVGSAGVILASVDGASWAVRSQGPRELFLDIAYGSGAFVAAGMEGRIATSSDGANWSFQAIGTAGSAPLIQPPVVYGNGVFAAWQGGYPSHIWTSPDGTTWTPSVWTFDFPRSAVFGNGSFVAVGYGGAILTSADGLSWIPRTSGTTAELTDIAYGNGLFVAVGKGGTVLTSADGVVWAASPTDAGGFFHVSYGNGRFIAMGASGSIFSSRDGANWVLRSPFSSDAPIRFGGNTFAIAGYEGNSGRIFTSGYGLIWTPRSLVQTPMLTGVAFGSSTLVAVGASGTILQSDPLENGDTASAMIEALYLAAESSLAAKDIGALMTLHHDGYLNGGVTKAIGQAFYERMFADYAGIRATFILADLALDGETATITEALTWQGTLVSTGEVHSRITTRKQTLKKTGASWQFYGDQAAYGVAVQTDRDAWSSGYGLSISIFDPNRTLTALSVSGPGITGSLDITAFSYDLATASWRSISPIVVGDSSGPPPLSSLAYAVSITDSQGSSQRSVSASALLPALTAEYVGPVNVAVRGSLTFRWATEGVGSPVSYRVLLYGDACPMAGAPPAGGPLWTSSPVAGAPYRAGSSWNVGTTSIPYSGPPLPNGDYCFAVQAVDGYGDTATANARSFRMAAGETSPLDLWYERNPHFAFPIPSYAAGNGITVVPGMNGRIMALNMATGASGEADVGVAVNLHGAAFGNGTFVVVGDGGAIAISQDAVAWNVVSSGTANALLGVAYGNGVFVAVGTAGTILTSANGESWTSRTSGTVQDISGIVYQNLLFMAVETSGTILTSGDGQSWISNPSWTRQDLRGIAYGDGIFVAIDGAGTVRTSAGGANWTGSGGGPGSPIDGLAFGNGVFVAVGGTAVFTSVDGVAWISRASGTTHNLRGVRFVRERFWALGEGGTMLTSTDGEIWTPQTSGTTAALCDVAYGANRHVAVGKDAILTSADGQSWSPVSSPATELVRIAYGNERFIALDGYGAILISADGTAWTKRAIGEYSQDVRIPGATRSALEAGSVTGVWTSTPPYPPSSWLLNQFSDIIFVGDAFVAATSGSILTSTDGAVWTYRQRSPWGDYLHLPTGYGEGLKAIAYGGGTFVVAGSGGAILQSDFTGELLEKGDLNGDQRVDLLDAIAALRVAAGINGSGIRPDFTSSGADVDGDHKVGLAEMVYILQAIAGSR
jgi:hypothetical protein